MSQLADNYQQNVHQFGLTVTWSILFNISVLCAILKHKKSAIIAHIVLSFMIFIMTFIFILYFLVPFGFNINLSVNPVMLYVHAVLGCALLGFVILQVIGGLLARFCQVNQTIDIFKLKTIKDTHKYFGYAMAIIYKIDILWAWAVGWVFGFLILWELAWIGVLVYHKKYYPKIQQIIVDEQTTEGTCREIRQVSEVENEYPKYVMFGNYVYDASELQQLHSGGYQVIASIMGREVDRFLFGMYSSELFPELPPYSHSAHCLELIGRPIARLTVPYPFSGFTNEVFRVKISEVEIVSSKTQIYALGLTSLETSLVFEGYTDIRQLGQSYNLTLKNSLTRIYTAVNFLNKSNIALMNRIFHLNSHMHVPKKRQSSMKQAELMSMQGSQPLIQQEQKQEDFSHCYIPIMIKIYNNGQFTSALLKANFVDLELQLSPPKGRGLQLVTTSPGCIIIVAGGTGLFPFSDLIDLVFKSQLIESKDALSEEIVNKNPVLKNRPFAKFSFVLLVAINEAEDIHPITMSQLRKLSMNSAKFKVVMRVSKNEKQVSAIKSGIEFTREYFTERVLTEGEVKDFSRFWICGPPKMSTDTAKNLLKNGYKKESILLL